MSSIEKQIKVCLKESLKGISKADYDDVFDYISSDILNKKILIYPKCQELDRLLTELGNLTHVTYTYNSSCVRIYSTSYYKKNFTLTLVDNRFSVDKTNESSNEFMNLVKNSNAALILDNIIKTYALVKPALLEIAEDTKMRDIISGRDLSTLIVRTSTANTMYDPEIIKKDLQNVKNQLHDNTTWDNLSDIMYGTINIDKEIVNAIIIQNNKWIPYFDNPEKQAEAEKYIKDNGALLEMYKDNISLLEMVNNLKLNLEYEIKNKMNERRNTINNILLKMNVGSVNFQKEK